MRIELPVIVLVVAGQAAQAQEAPLSAIDWLNERQELPAEPRETPVAPSAGVPEVNVAPLQDGAARRVGLAAATVTGLPSDLWSNSNGENLAKRIDGLPVLSLPAAQSLFFTLLLAEADPPESDADRFDLARVAALTRLGAVDPAIALLDQAGVATSPEHFRTYMDLALISGDADQACAVLRAHPHLSPNDAYRVYCLARGGDWETAALVLGTASTLGSIAPPMEAALARFLDPELFDESTAPPLPRHPDPLMFRLFEANGTPIPTRDWPRAYAHADLSDTAGWKARLEAAERLAQTGALSGNRLLGLYSERTAAASGGIWDRVTAIQRFDTALQTGSEDAIARALPKAWAAMRSAELSVVFATLYADKLAEAGLDGRSGRRLAFEVMLLSPSYEAAGGKFPDQAAAQPFLTAVAGGTAGASDLPPGTLENAIALGMADTTEGDVRALSSARAGHLGEALLDTLEILQEGADGDLARLTTALATLRRLGLEDTARRAALQLLLREDTT